MTVITCTQCGIAFAAERMNKPCPELTAGVHVFNEIWGAAPEQRPSVTREADELIRGERAHFYGHPSDNLERIAAGWSGYLSGRPDPEAPLEPHDVCMLMVILKAMRGAEGYQRDGAVDIAGYAGLDAVVTGDDPYKIDWSATS